MNELDKRKIIETLFNSNITCGVEIAKRTGIAKSTIYRAVAKLKSAASIERKEGSGKQLKLCKNLTQQAKKRYTMRQFATN